MLRNFGPWEILAILAVALLLFGGKKIPEVAKGLGEGIRNFKASLKGDDAAPPPTKRSRLRLQPRLPALLAGLVIGTFFTRPKTRTPPPIRAAGF